MLYQFEKKRDIVSLEKLNLLDYKKINNNISNIENIYEDENSNHFFKLIKKPYFIYKIKDDLYVYEDKYESNDDLNDVFYTKYGIFQSIDNGEFGGHLFLKTPFGNEYIMHGNIKYLKDFNEKILFVDSCKHLMGNLKIGLFQLNKNNLNIDVLIDNVEESFIDAFVDGDIIYILSSKVIYKLTTMGISSFINLEELEVGSFRNSNSFALLNNVFYIGMNKQIITIDINTKATIIYTKESDDEINQLLEYQKQFHKLFLLN